MFVLLGVFQSCKARVPENYNFLFVCEVAWASLRTNHSTVRGFIGRFSYSNKALIEFQRAYPLCGA